MYRSLFGVFKTLIMSNIKTSLIKAEDPNAYKKLAEKGLMIGHPVKIKGQDNRPDIGIPYHSTIKFFDADKHTPGQVHEVANKLKMNPPDPKKTHIEPGQFKDRFGNDVHVLKLKGPHADEMKEHNKKFSHMGNDKFDYHPHISVDKATWDKIKSSGAKTAQDAGIEFGDAQIRSGHNVNHDYSSKIKKSEITYLDMIRETVSLDFDLKKNHWKAIYLDDENLKNYIEDNSFLKKSIEESHSKRIACHFDKNIDVASIAWEYGIKAAYESLRKI